MSRVSGENYEEIRRKMPEPMFKAYREMTRAAWQDGTLDAPLREMLRLKSAELAKCALGSQVRSAEAEQQGLTEEKIKQIAHPERSNLPESEKLALLLAELYIVRPEDITDDLFDQLKRHFSEAQLVEMLFFVGICNLLHRFNTAIDVQPSDAKVVVHATGYATSSPGGAAER